MFVSRLAEESWPGKPTASFSLHSSGPILLVLIGEECEGWAELVGVESVRSTVPTSIGTLTFCQAECLPKI